ncbi:hypothetical protein F4806DRAFT_496845 [Annulohypoxylon nitens]|nr:hypothetical protein F4806DRAFT_496845 [Annulohypoxylon nitens]
MHKQLTWPLLVLAAATTTSAPAQVLAQDLSWTIVGCVEFECPASSYDTANDNCTIADTGSFPYIGLTRASSNASSSSSPLSSLSWVKGVNITDTASRNPSSNSSRTFHSSFYLGAPPSFSLNASTGACAVFLRGAESWDLSFGGNATDEVAEGTCADAMGSSCVLALVARAKAWISEYYSNSSSGGALSNKEPCERLRLDLLDGESEACVSVSKGSWSNFTAVALAGDDAPTPISRQENSSSTCWPIIPKEDSLTLVAEFSETGSDLVADAEDAFWAITPILTVLFPLENGVTENAIDASLSCVKAMGPARASVDTINNGTDDQDNGASIPSSPYPFAATASYMIATVLFILYIA